jgi:predicted short-subunit dehydrogenase-like oxidoreductase (DUF2520 family)
MVTFNIIGAGRLGKQLAFALCEQKIGQLQAVCNAHEESAQAVVSELGKGIAVSTLSKLPSAKLYFLTVPDASIASLTKNMQEECHFSPQSIVIHCSGVLDTSVLAPLKERGVSVVSLHFLKAFAKGPVQKDVFRNCDCTFEGEEEAYPLISTICAQLGCRLTKILSGQKALYHAGAVIASNYLVTLAAVAKQCFTRAGMDVSSAHNIVANLLQGSVDNVRVAALEDALTGPLARGDIPTLIKHLEVLDKETAAFYKKAMLVTLPLTALSDAEKDKVIRLSQA